MKARAVIILLLIYCLGASPAAAGARFAKRAARAQLTTEEESAAREFGRRFAERFRETNDIAPIVEEMYVEDFADRLRHDDEYLPMCFLRREVAAQATPAELRKFYVAQFNFVTLTLAYWMTRPEGPGGDAQEEPTLEQMFPPEVFGLLSSSPHFAAYITGEKPAAETPDEKAADAGGPAAASAAAPGEAKPGEAKKDERDADRIVTSLAVLREMTATTELAVEALRPHVPPYVVLREALRAKGDDTDYEEVHTPHLETREEPFYGFAPGTRFVCVTVEPLHNLQFQILAVTVGGRLKIVTAMPVLGD